MASLGSSADIPIYTGLWINWSRGHITGATLTLGRRNGAVLTAFLAIFITLVGTSFWRITSFSLHQFRSSHTPKYILYHQTQAILRNSANGTTGFTRFFGILWAWRHKQVRAFRRMIPLITTTILSTAVFAVASTFSARIGSEIGNEVLISSKSCGVLSTGNSTITTDHVERIFHPYISKRFSSFANYVQTCYTNITEAEGCGSLIKRQLVSTIDRNASCPFHKDICRSTNGNIQLDTGYLNIASDLGLNVPPSHQYTIRFVTDCAPLITDGYKTRFNYSNDISYMRYFYGPKTYGPRSEQFGNYTYESQMPSASRIISEQLNTGWGTYKIGYVYLKLVMSQGNTDTNITQVPGCILLQRILQPWELYISTN